MGVGTLLKCLHFVALIGSVALLVILLIFYDKIIGGDAKTLLTDGTLTAAMSSTS